MIATILPGSADFHAVGYNEHKVSKGLARLIEMRNFGTVGLADRPTTEELTGYLKKYSSTNNRIRKPQFHVAVSCKGREMTESELLDFAHRYLKEMGYAYNLSPSRKYWTVIPKGYDKPIRLKNLGADYTNDRIVERIKENRDRWAEIEPFQRATYKPRQYRMQTRGQKLKKKGGLYGLYLYYCYRLGYLPKYKKQNNARLHYLLKDDLMKLDKITDEVRLLGRENISTDEQLFSYKTSLEEQMKNLLAGRTHLRKKIRTNIDDGQLQAAKDEIASINGELKKLRREVKLCEDIAERSKVMEENLEHIETEEQKQQRKEKSRYEQRW